jgi:hypothetical protein
MLNADPKRPLGRVVAAVAGLAILGWGFHSIFGRGDLHYVNWFGELVFAPLAILFGLVIIFGALFKAEILGTPAPRARR